MTQRIAILHVRGIDLGVLACFERAFRRLGYAVRVWRIPPVDEAVKSPSPASPAEVRRWERLLAAVRAFRPDFGFGLDTFPLLYEPSTGKGTGDGGPASAEATAGKRGTGDEGRGTRENSFLRHLFEVAGVPLAIFWTNAPRRSLMPMDSAPPMGLSRSRVTHFVPDSEEAAALERLGLRARYLPLGTFFHEARPPAALLRRFRAEVAFVGHAAVREDGADLIGARFGAWVRRAVDAAARSVLAGWPPMRALAEAIAALPEADRRAARAAARRAAEAGLLLRQVVATASVRRRCSIVGSLGRPALVYGDPSDWPLAHPRVLRRPPVNYHVELPALYRATAVNLNVTNPQFPRAVNQRVFDVPAAGGFLLTDRRGDLARHFIPGREVVVYDGLPDLREKVRWHLAHPAERRRIAGRARARCRAEHSWLDRARTIATAMTEL